MKNSNTEEDQKSPDKNPDEWFAVVGCPLINQKEAPSEEEGENDEEFVLYQKFNGCFYKSISRTETHEASGSSIQEILDGVNQQDAKQSEAAENVNDLYAFAQILEQNSFFCKSRSGQSVFQMVRFKWKPVAPITPRNAPISSISLRNGQNQPRNGPGYVVKQTKKDNLGKIVF